MHTPETCPYCGDFQSGLPSVFDPELNVFKKHVLAKLAELESRVQREEWRDMPIGPRPESYEPDPKVVEALVERARKAIKDAESESNS